MRVAIIVGAPVWAVSKMTRSVEGLRQLPQRIRKRSRGRSTLSPAEVRPQSDTDENKPFLCAGASVEIAWTHLARRRRSVTAGDARTAHGALRVIPQKNPHAGCVEVGVRGASLAVFVPG
jgi:hypothetical protein